MTGRSVKIERREMLSPGHLRLEKYFLRHSLFEGGMGNELAREVINRGSAVAVLPYDPVRDEIVMVEQFRIGPYVHDGSAWTLEFIAGLVEPGEDKTEVARREAEEEAGLKLKHLEHLFGFYTTPGAMSEYIDLFWARVDSSQIGGLYGLAHEGEDIKVHVMPFRDAEKKLRSGFFSVGPMIIALQWLLMNRKRIRSDAGF